MIGYDLDGVLVADVHPITPENLAYRINMLPLFIPSGDYCIVTSRPFEDYSMTVTWALRFLQSNPPVTIYHGDYDVFSDDVAHAFKAKTLLANNIHTYVESNPATVKYLRSAVPECRVLHFAECLAQQFSPLEVGAL